VVERTVKIRVGVDISGLPGQMRAATAAFQDFSKKATSYIEKNSASITDLSNTVGVVGAGLTALAATAVTKFAQFDKAMSSVAATGDDARGSLNDLRAAAVKAGADTAFSATEAAGAIEQLAKAGVSAKDILGGGLDGALALAAAGEIDVAQAAETAASAMTQFGLKGTDVGHIADLLAAGAGKAQGGVLDMGQALNQAGLIAGQVGLSIEETTGSLAAMASAGLVGSDAGTSLKTSLIALSSPSSVAAKEMERLGISAYNAQGNFIGMEALAGQLQTQLGGLTDEQRNSALATIFGTDALRTANVLYSEGAAGIAEWTSAVNDQGYAAETAATQTNNLLGDIERLGGSLDTVLIQSGSGANDVLRQMAQGAEGVVDALGQIPAPALSATTMIAGAGGLALLGVAGMGKLTVATRDTIGAYRDLVPAGSRADGAVRKFGRGATITAGALTAVVLAAQAIESTAPDVSLGVEDMRSRLRALGEDGADTSRVFEDLNSTWVNFEGFSADSSVVKDAEAFQELLRQTADPGFIGGAQQQLGSLLGLMGSSDIGQFQTRLAGVNTELANMVGAGNLETAQQSFLGLTEAYKLTDEQAGQLLTTMPAFRDSLIGQAESAGIVTNDATLLKIALGELSPAQEAAAGAADQMAGATEGATDAVLDNSEAIRENLGLAAEAAGIVLSEREAQRSLEAAFDDATAAIKENGKTLDVTTEKGRANQSALDAVADGAWVVAESMYAAGASSKAVAGRMQEARDAFIRTAMSAGHTKAEARELANELHLVPSDVETILKARDNATGTINRVKGELQGLQNKTITITTIRQVLGSDKGGASQYVMRRAGGGSAIGPGTGTSDSIPALLSNGEHVWTASEVQAVGGQAAMYRMRSAAQSGLLRFASGGAVGQAESEVRRAQRLSLSARRALSDARRAERNARLESTKREAEKRVARAEQLLNDRQEAVNDARAKVERLREEASSLRTDLRRGNVRDSVTGGLSGALGVTDQLRDLAASGDVSKFGSRRLSNIAGDAEKALTGLYKQAEAIDKKLDSATSNFEKWKGIADGVSSSISGAFSLGDVSGGVDPWSGKEKQATGKGLLAASQEYQTKARNLVLKLRALQEAGYGTAILQEVARQGVDGGVAMADALLQLSPADAKALQASQEMIGFYAGRAGIAATDDQVTAAARAVEAAEAQARAIDKNIDRWAEKLGSAMARALGIKARASGGPVTAGHGYLVNEDTPRSELFIPSQSGYVLNNRQQSALTAGPQKVVNVYVTQNYPQAIPYQKGINKALQHAAEEVLG
jgi:TP901 family phage tail tape measure protein